MPPFNSGHNLTYEQFMPYFKLQTMSPNVTKVSNLLESSQNMVKYEYTWLGDYLPFIRTYVYFRFSEPPVSIHRFQLKVFARLQKSEDPNKVVFTYFLEHHTDISLETQNGLFWQKYENFLFFRTFQIKKSIAKNEKATNCSSFFLFLGVENEMIFEIVKKKEFSILRFYERFQILGKRAFQIFI